MFWKINVKSSSSSRSDAITTMNRKSDEPGTSSDDEGITSSSSSSDSTIDPSINNNGIPEASHSSTVNEHVKFAAAITNSPKSSSRRSIFFRRTLTVTFEVLIVLSFVLYQSVYLLDYVANEYITQWIDIQRWTEFKKRRSCTYYGRFCYKGDMTARSPEELLFNNQTSNFVDHMNTHGALLMPNILSEKTATELREFVIEQNMKQGKSISLMEMTNRWSFSLVIDSHPSVRAAVDEILSNDVLMQGMEELIGHVDPAFIELSVITSAYGAVKQTWHSDSVGDASGALFARNFIPSYSVFIPLQNTTEAMGATVVAPGTHVCYFSNKTIINSFPLSGPNDNWPAGHGVVMNSQLAHYGPAYTDPNGEPRVILIPTFTTRPVLSRNQRVETRIVSHGTVYGIDWTQLGHTVSDWKGTMKYPWRALRSLNIITNHPNYVGWSFWDQNLNRIAVNDVDIYPADLQDYLPHPVIAKVLFGNLVPDSDEIDDTDKGKVLTEFILNVINRWTAIFSKLQWTLVGLYFCFLYFQTKKKGAVPSVFQKYGPALSRILVAEYIIYMMYTNYETKIDTSAWAKNIRSGRLLNLPSWVVQYPDTPSTIPTQLDILQTNHIQSEWLGAYRKVIDTKHPGNRFWYNKVISEYTPGFQYLPIPLQEVLCTAILESIKQDQRRILTKNAPGDWTVVSDVEAKRFCQTSLMKGSDRYIYEIIEQIDFLRAETSYGYFRNTTLHQKYIPALLLDLRDAITKFNNTLHKNYTSSSSNNNNNVNTFSSKERKKIASIVSPLNLQKVQRVFPVPILMPSRSKLSRTPSTIPYVVVPKNNDEVIEEPFPGAWFEEGDLVEVLYKDEDDEEYWYMATITDIITYKRTFDVVFEDGEPYRNVKPNKIRRPIPYQVDEEIEVDIKNTYNFQDGRIIKISSDQEYVKVAIYKTQSIQIVSRAQIRRSPETLLVEAEDDVILNKPAKTVDVTTS